MSFLFDRQRQLLALLDVIGGNAQKLDFQKLLFLYCQEAGDAAAPYAFVPYRFGAFSFTSYADARKLTERGLLVEDERQWTLTDAGRSAVRSAATFQLAAFAKRHSELRGDDLVAETYRRFPWYATRSEMAARVLRGDDAALLKVEEARPVATKHMLSTIGYEGRTLESYLNALLHAGATLLCDVRRNPISRKYGFSKNTLKKGCEGVGIRYEHTPTLGISSEQRQSLDTQADYDALFAKYERDDLPKQAATVNQIQGWLDEGESVALTCYEKLPHQCHRHCVAEAIEARSPKTAATTRHL